MTMLVNENEPLVSEILNRKVREIDCTEAESVEIKGFIRENLYEPLTDFFIAVRDNFPIEYSEICEETD